MEKIHQNIVVLTPREEMDVSAKVFVYLSFETALKIEHFNFSWRGVNGKLCFTQLQKSCFSIEELEDVILQSGYKNYEIIAALTPLHIVEKQLNIGGVKFDEANALVKTELTNYLSKNNLERNDISFSTNLTWDMLDRAFLNLSFMEKRYIHALEEKYYPLKIDRITTYTDFIPETFIGLTSELDETAPRVCLYLTKNSLICFFVSEGINRSACEIKYSEDDSIELLYKKALSMLKIKKHKTILYFDKNVCVKKTPENWIVIDNNIPLLPISVSFLN